MGEFDQTTYHFKEKGPAPKYPKGGGKPPSIIGGQNSLH